MKTSLIGYTIDELTKLLESLGEKKYRAKQIFEWIYKKNARVFDDMTNLSISLRDTLNKYYTLRTFEMVEEIDLGDTVKYLWKLSDGQMMESVLMPSENRVTLCISSQIGCAVDCKFCATGQMGFKRNLTTGEILEQILNVSDKYQSRISNIVFMGMGEPFLNYDNVNKAATIMNSSHAFEISTRKITISTSGILPRIYQYADEKQPFGFAISLNDVDQARREKSMPISKKWPITELIKAAKHYTKQVNRRITFEYVMVKNSNISYEDAQILMKLTDSINCKINLIPCNTDMVEYPRPSEEEVESFLEYLNKSARPILLRKTRGRNIDAACGMLHTKISNEASA